VWTVRLLFALAVAGLMWTYSYVMDLRTADLRVPQVALAADSQSYTDTAAALTSHVTQLALLASTTTYAGRPVGPVAPATLTVQSVGGRWSARISGSGTVGESGYPLLTQPLFEVVAHRLDRRGLVKEITIECRYSFLWDRGASRGEVLAEGVPLPTPNTTERVAGGLLRHSDAYTVVDRLVLVMNNRTAHWEVQTAERLSRNPYR